MHLQAVLKVREIIQVSGFDFLKISGPFFKKSAKGLWSLKEQPYQKEMESLWTERHLSMTDVIVFISLMKQLI